MYVRDFISLACKFNALEKRFHSLLDNPRMYMTLSQGQEMALTFNTIIPS